VFAQAKLYAAALVAAVLFGGGVYVGHYWGESSRLDLSNKLAISDGNLSACGASLIEVNKQFEANRRAADEQKARADQAEKDAQKGRQEYSKALDQIDAEQAAARKEPGCAAQLEARICVALH
jgi:hypothetical protein